MPIRKPDNVIEHRLTLGKKEWQALQPSILAVNATLVTTALGVAAVGVGGAVAGYTLYQWLKDGPFEPLTDAMKDIAPIVAGEEGASQAWGTKNPILQLIPNIGWLRGSEYSAWW